MTPLQGDFALGFSGNFGNPGGEPRVIDPHAVLLNRLSNIADKVIPHSQYGNDDDVVDIFNIGEIDLTSETEAYVEGTTGPAVYVKVVFFELERDATGKWMVMDAGIVSFEYE